MNKLLLVCVIATLCVCVYGKTKWYELDHYDFEAYVNEYSKVYDSAEYVKRKQIFDNNLKIIKYHNKHVEEYKKGVNHLTDQTDTEINALMGYKRSAKPSQSALFQQPPTTISLQGLPERVDWREKNVVSPVKDQGRCGSCWSFATAATVESHYALLTGKLPILSEQQILDCVPNPNECGGTGGCNGGTADIAYEKLQTMGLASEWTYPYISYFGQDYTCKFNKSLTTPVAFLKGYTKAIPNHYDSVISMLAVSGPLAINVAAAGWHSYEEGLYTACTNQTTDINHVVQLVGYGTDPKLGDYWLIRNSWTPSWGEGGYMRLPRVAKAECGIDKTPLDGTGCKDGPSEVTVCGPCGLLYDASHPIMTTVPPS